MLNSQVVFTGLLLLSLVASQSPDAGVTTDQDKDFIPTNEWQTVKPGQQIPPGLHIRQSLKTGHTEAKLMDAGTENQPSYPTLVVSPEKQQPVNEPNRDTPHQSEKIPQLPHIPTNQTGEFAQSSRKFRSYEAIKADFDALNFSVKSDIELLDELMVKLGNATEKNQILNVLGDLEYLLHQVDNGYHFAENDGFALVRRFLLDESEEVRKASFAAVTAAVQGNSKVRVLALQNGVLDILHQLLLTSSTHPSSGTRSRKLMSTYLTTLGSLLRDFPSAQTYFFTSPTVGRPGLSGSNLLSKLSDAMTISQSNSADTTLQIKVISLLADLITERTNARAHSQQSSDPNVLKLWELYSEINLANILLKDGWCVRIERLLLQDLEPAVDPAKLDEPFNHDRREKILQSTLHWLPICNQWVPNAEVDSTLRALENEYLHRAKVRDDKFDYYFSDLHHLVKRVRTSLSELAKDTVPRTEL